MNWYSLIHLSIWILIHFWTSSLHAQRVDSIWASYTQHVTDWEHRFDSVLHYCKQHKNQLTVVKVALLDRLEPYLGEVSDHAKSRYFLARSQAFIEKEDYTSAQENAFKAGSLQTEDQNLEMRIYVQIASIYYAIAQYDKSLDFTLKAFNLSRVLVDSMEIAAGHNRIGDAYRRMGKRDSALIYLNKAIELRTILNDNLGLAKAYNNLGIYYIESDPMTLEAHIKALDAWKASLTFKEAIADTAGMILTHLNLAKAGATPDRDTDQIMYHLNRALDLSKASNFNRGLRASYRDRAIFFAQLEMFQLAYSAQNEYVKFNQDVINEATQKKLAELEILYETQLREKEINLLSAENSTQAQKLQKQRWMIGSGVAITALLLLSLVMLRRNSTLKLLNLENEVKHAADLHQREMQLLKQKQDNQLISALVNGQEQERKRIAQDLHDGIGGLMTGIKLNLSTITNNLFDKSQHKLLDRTSNLVENAGKELRQIAHNLMPPAISRYGLDRALKSVLQKVNERNKTVNVTYQSFGLANGLPEETEIHLYRVIQELTNNAIKHSKAKNILIDINVDDGIHLVVEDDGIGFDSSTLGLRDGVGLQSVDQRVAALGGELRLESKPGKGTSFDIFISADTMNS